jgi:hypothetical protein
VSSWPTAPQWLKKEVLLVPDTDSVKQLTMSCTNGKIYARILPGDESIDTDVSGQSLARYSISCTPHHTLTRAQWRA